jgi:hypothetical protein
MLGTILITISVASLAILAIRYNKSSHKGDRMK